MLIEEEVDNKYIGLVRLSDITSSNKKQVILVDHNESTQSVDGLEEAEIIEIVDHHKIGTIGTSVPINFRNMPVGSSNTIIALLYKENNIEIPKNIDLEEAKNIIRAYKDRYNASLDNDEWFNDLKEFAVENGYAKDRKKFKKHPEEYKGMVSDVAGAVRSAVTHRSNTPDLHTIMDILGEEKVRERFEKFIK